MFTKIKLSLISIVRGIIIAVILLSMTINFKTNVKIEAVNPNLKYFGYFNGGLPTDVPLLEINNLGNNNISYFQLDFYSAAANQIAINKAKLAGYQKIILNMDVFFDDLTPNRVFPAKNYTTQDWEDKFKFLEDSTRGNENNIYAFYWDEPVLQSYDEAKFVDLTARLKNRFPNIGRMIIEGSTRVDQTPFDTTDPIQGGMINSNFVSNLTDIGYDGYYYTDARSSNSSYKTRTQNLINRLATIADKGQKLWLVPDSFVSSPACVEGSNYLLTAINEYYDVAMNSPRVVGMLPYYYYLGGAAEVVAQNLFNPSDPCYNPTLKQKHIDIGQSIIANVDITAPTKPVTTSKNVTTFSGTAEASAKIKGYDPAGGLVCDVFVSTTGSWTCPYPNTGQLVKFFAVDAADNWSQPESFNPNLQYFGYWNGSADPRVSTSFAGIKNLGNSNMVMFPFGTTDNDQQYFRDRLAEIKQSGLKVILGIDFRFIEYLDGGLTFVDAEFERRFQIIERTIAGYEDMIYAFEWEEGNIGIESRFVDVTARLKKRFPYIGRMAVLSYPQVDGSDPTVWRPATSNLLTNLTDVGYDFYVYQYYPNNSNVVNYNAVKLYAEKITSLANNNQKLWFLPEVSVIGNCTNGTTNLENAIEGYRDIASKNPRFVGMLGYLWNVYPADLTYPDPNNRNIDAQALFDSTNPCYNPTLKQKHIDIGKSVVANVDMTATIRPAIINISGGPTSYTLTGKSEPQSKVKIFDNLGNIFCDAVTTPNGDYTCPIAIMAGSNNKLKLFAVDNSGNWSQPIPILLNGNCEYKNLPTIGNDLSFWGDMLNSVACQTLVTNGPDTGKIRSDIGGLTDTCKVGIGTNNPTTPLAIVGLVEYATESAAITAGLKNGDFYRTGTSVKVVVGGSNIVERVEGVDTGCSPASPNRLPIANGDGNEWGNILNHFLCNTRVNNSNIEDSGKFKTNLASITAGGKVSIGTTPSSVTKFAVAGLPNYTNISETGLKNGDIYQTNGSLKVTNSPNSSNILAVNIDDCYISGALTRLPKVGQDIDIWGNLLNNYLCRTILKGATNSGKLKTDLGSIVQGGKIGVGTNNPTSVFAIPNLPEFVDNTAAIGGGLKAGDFYRVGGAVWVVI